MNNEIKAIREWSRAVEKNPNAFGPPIDKQRAIKVLIAALDKAEADASGYVRGLEEAAKVADKYAAANKAHAILPIEIAANIRALISQHEVKIK